MRGVRTEIKKKKIKEEKLETEKILSTLIFSENCQKKKKKKIPLLSIRMSWSLGQGMPVFNGNPVWEPLLSIYGNMLFIAFPLHEFRLS